MNKRIKYREYRYNASHELIDIKDVPKLPRGVQKIIGDEWVTGYDVNSEYSKVCRINSNSTFGTGLFRMPDSK